MRIVNRAHLPWFVFVVIATIFAAWLYIGNFSPQSLPSALQLPRVFVQKPVEYRNAGGTPLGLIIGSIALSIFVFAALLGVRKKVVLCHVCLPTVNQRGGARGAAEGQDPLEHGQSHLAPAIVGDV